MSRTSRADGYGRPGKGQTGKGLGSPSQRQRKKPPRKAGPPGERRDQRNPDTSEGGRAEEAGDGRGDTSGSHSDETRVLPRGSLALEALRSRGASQRVPKTRNHSREGRVLGDAGGTARPRACAPRVTAEGALPSRRPQPSAPAPAPLQGRVAVSPRGLLSLSPNGTVRKVGVTDLRRASDGKPADDPF